MSLFHESVWYTVFRIGDFFMNTKRSWPLILCVFCILGTLSSSLMAVQTPLTTVRVAAGFNQPVYVTSPPDSYNRLFVIEQRGEVKIVKDGNVLGTPFIDLADKVSQSGNEKGLLGLAFHPDYTSNGYFYVNYTQASGGATVVERYTVSQSDPDEADASSGVIVLGPISQPFTNHNGGNIQFGPDGKLYVGMGDGGSGGDPGCLAQQGSTMMGKMLRINDDGTIPENNPFVGDPEFLDEIWAYGLRNPWRFSFDRETGDMYIGDVGQSQWEEIDFQPGSSSGGENYGWKIMEGAHCFSSSNCPDSTPPCNDPSLTIPIFEYGHSAGNCSVTGGYVYRGCSIPNLQGTYFFADYCTARIVSFRYDGNNITELRERTSELDPGGGLNLNLITSFGEDASGELYIVDQGGEIFKIVPDAPVPYEDLGFALPGTNGVEPRLDICGLLGDENTAVVRLHHAAPSARAVLAVSFTMNPIPLFGGFLVPGLPLWKRLEFTTDEEGNLELPISGGGGPLDVYGQFLIEDPGAVGGVAFSNAIRAIFQP